MICALTLVGGAGAVHRSVADLAQAGPATMSLRGDAAVPG
jgi:hypothetical protein